MLQTVMTPYRPPSPRGHRRAALFLVLAALPPGAWAETTAPEPEEDAGALEPVVVRGTRAGADRWRSPASIDVVTGEDMREGRPQISLAEGLGRVPGLVVRDRQNFAQDLQLSIRGFGARSSFGVRGLKLYLDGIPASAPDGQGQTSHFPLTMAERVEVVRGPFAALYGASSGGVLSLYTEDGKWPGEWRAGFAAGSDGTWRLSTAALGRTAPPDQPGWSYALSLSGFTTDGARAQNSSTQGTANVKLTREDADGKLTLLFNRHHLIAKDPLGLTRAEFDADPHQTTPNALKYDTRKSVSQTQLGVAWQRRLNADQKLELIGWWGQRGVWQYQSIPPSAQAAPTSAGGVIDLDRAYGGFNGRWRMDRTLDGGAQLGLVAGLTWSRQNEARKGYENFIGQALGVRGRLRRDENNMAEATEPYVQGELAQGAWTLSGGLRYSRVKLGSRDHYIVPGNGDDSGSVRYAGFIPVIGARVQLAESLQAFGSIGRGLETPTLNEVAYSPIGGGMNRGLNGSRGTSAEVGLRGRHGWGGWTATAFEVRTDDEIVPAVNQGGRATYQNAGRTRRHGLELAADAEFGPLTVTTAATLMQARFRDGYDRCVAASCNNPADHVPAGKRIPGIPEKQLWLQLAYKADWARGAVVSLDTRYVGRVAVDDVNSDFASSATVFGLSVRHDFSVGDWRLQPFARIDNLTNRKWAGSVIVNEANGRFFEPAPGRSYFVGLDIRAKR